MSDRTVTAADEGHYRWGVRVRDASEYRRVAKITAATYLISSIAGLMALAGWRHDLAHPTLHAATLVYGFVGGLALVVVAYGVSDASLERFYPSALPPVLVISLASVLLSCYAMGFAKFGVDALFYDVVIVLGFYVLHERVAMGLLGFIAVAHALLLSVSPGVAGVFPQWFYVVFTVAVTGLMIGRAMSDFDQSRREYADLNRTLEQRVAEQIQEIRESRARIVEASDESRRRIERNIHDGAQQHLVAISLDLRMLAEEAAQLPPEEVRSQLNAAHANLKVALDDLRELARGLHPAVLTSDGLEAALGQLAARVPLPVSLVAPSSRFAGHLETAAYFVAAEAVANVVKYADASSIAIRVEPYDGTLEVSVADDGRGGAMTIPSGGLCGLADRVAALGGSLDVTSPVGGGTTVRAALPLQPRDAIQVLSPGRWGADVDTFADAPVTGLA